MSIKIGIPNKDIYNPLFSRFDEIKDKYDLQLFRDEGYKLSDLFKQNKLDIALLSPLGYGKGVGVADYRIIPSNCIALENYTGAASIYFNRTANRFRTMASFFEHDYITIAARVVLAERYDAFPEVKQLKLDLTQMLEKCDTAVVWKQSTGDDFALDLSEQWFDTYEFPLPLGFWVCKAEEHPENALEIVNELADINLPAEQAIREDIVIAGTEYVREGNIHYKWSDDIETAFFDTLQLLYVLQIFKEIPAVKVLGRD